MRSAVDLQRTYPAGRSAGMSPAIRLLFTPLRLGPLTLPNRIVCVPLYLAYPDPDNEVNELVLDYYAEMADSGAGLVVVKNVTVEPCGLTNPRTLLASHDRFVPGLARLAKTIRARGVPAVLQLHHAGRYARRPDGIAPSAIETWGAIPRAMDAADIERVVAAFAAGARRAREAGFDAVELHGGTGYLLAQFLSPRTNPARRHGRSRRARPRPLRGPALAEESPRRDGGTHPPVRPELHALHEAHHGAAAGVLRALAEGAPRALPRARGRLTEARSPKEHDDDEARAGGRSDEPVAVGVMARPPDAQLGTARFDATRKGPLRAP
jgi:hypothetical protein